jgi:hypothetical protein
VKKEKQEQGFPFADTRPALHRSQHSHTSCHVPATRHVPVDSTPFWDKGQSVRLLAEPRSLGTGQTPHPMFGRTLCHTLAELGRDGGAEAEAVTGNRNCATTRCQTNIEDDIQTVLTQFLSGDLISWTSQGGTVDYSVSIGVSIRARQVPVLAAAVAIPQMYFQPSAVLCSRWRHSTHPKLRHYPP